MHVYRADEPDATRLLRILGDQGLPAQVERFGPAIYVVVRSTRPDIAHLAQSAGRSVRRVPNLDQLAAEKA